MADDYSEPEKWKHKYLETLEQLEEKERAWRRSDDSLRHGLSRLALVSTGLDAGLDVQLRKLRRALQDQVKGDHLDELVAKISDYLKTLDEQGGVEPAGDPESASVELLLKLMDAIEFPPRCQSRVKRLRRALGGRDAGSRLEAHLEAFTALVVSAFYPDEDAATRPSGGWWQRLVGGESRVAAPAADSASVSDSPAAPVLETVLLRFLDELIFPAPFSARVQALKKRLEAGLPAAAVGELVKGMVGLVNEVQEQLVHEKEELELFLDQLGQRLQALDSMVDGAENQRQASLTSGRELDEIVKAEVNDIERSVDRATDAGEMKGLIQGSLENIRRHLAERRRQEEQRQSALEQQLKAVNHRLVELEGESERLRARLAEERIQAMIDPLTRVANRLGYERRMAQEFARWQRYHNPLSLLVCDIDHFKRINDTYGHKAGDRALMAIAKSINQHLRQTDFVARVGGEEFIVLLPETPLQAADAVAQKLCTGVAACAFVYEGKPVPITMSIGLAAFAEGDEVDEVYRRADRALYQAKAQGRNRFVTAD